MAPPSKAKRVNGTESSRISNPGWVPAVILPLAGVDHYDTP